MEAVPVGQVRGRQGEALVTETVNMNIRSLTSALRNIALLLPYDPAQAVMNLEMLADRVEEMAKEQASS